MSFFKSVATAAAVCGVITASTPEANAGTYRSGTILGYHAEILESGSYSQSDYIEVYGPNGKEQIIVVCSPYDWQSTGPNSATFVDSIARAWCF